MLRSPDRTVADRVGVSSISFRFRPLPEALSIIAATGATEIDLGAIPAVTDHVPVPFSGDPGDYVQALDERGLRSGAVNADVGDLNDPQLTTAQLRAVARPLIELAAATGGALIVPAGRADYAPFVTDDDDIDTLAKNLDLLSGWCRQSTVRLLVEVVHHHRFSLADRLLARLGPEVFGLLFDVSHIVASGDDPVAWAARVGHRVERVHLRDAVAGDLNLGIGRGEVDFPAVIAALETAGFTGTYILELETHDVAEHDREADARRSRALIIDLLEQTR
jgi:sugar phosphate isomerase/epimerase